jgi:poly(A) polymerase
VIDALLADPALCRVLDALPHARVVGGAVRDALADRPIADIDLATPDAPEVSQAALEAAGMRVVQTGIAHGTITAISDGIPYEITTLRHDLATDGRHAEVAWTTDWQADAARRDFTINAMSLDRAGNVHDYFGGQADLTAGRIRFVGDPATRIAEDYLRILRFFRFFARYGGGAPDEAALAAIRAAIPGLARLSAERVWAELKGLSAAPDPLLAVRLMAETGVLAAVIPEGAEPSRLAALLETDAPSDSVLRVAALLTGDEATFAARLNLSNAEAARLQALAHGPVPSPADADVALRRFLADEPTETLVDRTYVSGGAGPEWNDLRARLRSMQRPIFPLEGRDALALGYAAGPTIGQALRETRAAWLAEGCVAPQEVLLDALRVNLEKARSSP